MRLPRLLIAVAMVISFGGSLAATPQWAVAAFISVALAPMTAFAASPSNRFHREVILGADQRLSALLKWWSSDVLRPVRY